MFKRLDLAIINRSFWPVYPVIGEALMRFAEQQSHAQSVAVILQDHADIKTHLKREERGQGVQFFPCHALSVSGSSILRRAVDAVFFMLWVFSILMLKRPKKVYVSTDPPVLVPFIVMIYCKIFRANYVYHLQDIHPEAANVVIPVKPLLFRVLKGMDSITMRHADLLITITKEMAEQIRKRSLTVSPIELLENPSVSFDHVVVPAKKKPGFTFCGNAGRLQRMPILIQAIKQYCQSGGTLQFVFAGAGVYANQLQELAETYVNVSYKGLVSASEAAQLSADYEWALLPIEDEVTQFAFPSKSSSYVFSGAKILAVCGDRTSVAEWVTTNGLGVVIGPSVNSLCQIFFAIESGEYDQFQFNTEREQLKRNLGFDVFVSDLTELVLTSRD
ncbi:glycosyltransferase [Shewanella algae]|uniref:glycosyltransferase n=1 Tax=Shewanella algae TaxID=38313 RepID=UPI0008DC6CD9|nr:glycosyltransferase [Shewanella algae]OHY54776.1 glycosyltransferase [Shewanella algae]TVL04637.1 glycosyltransferase [Shewanella algae]